MLNHDNDIGALVELASATDGCITTAQLHELGYKVHEIRELIRRGIIRRVLRGVYVVATQALTLRQARRAALLVAGPDSHLFGRTALDHARIAKPHREGHLWIGTTHGQRRPLRTMKVGLVDSGRRPVVHIVRCPATVPLTTVDGLPSATVARALVDVAAREPIARVKGYVREADFLTALHTDELWDELDLGRPGSAALQTVLPAGPLATSLRGGAESRAEYHLLRGLLDRGMEPPAVNDTRFFDGREVRPDLAYWLRGLLVEVDGPHHEHPARRAEDEERDAFLAQFGLETVRIPTRDVRRHLADCVDRVERALAARHRPSTA